MSGECLRYLEGPTGTPYDGGHFVLDISIPAESAGCLSCNDGTRTLAAVGTLGKFGTHSVHTRYTLGAHSVHTRYTLGTHSIQTPYKLGIHSVHPLHSLIRAVAYTRICWKMFNLGVVLFNIWCTSTFDNICMHLAICRRRMENGREVAVLSFVGHG